MKYMINCYLCIKFTVMAAELVHAARSKDKTEPERLRLVFREW